MLPCLEYLAKIDGVEVCDLVIKNKNSNKLHSESTKMVNENRLLLLLARNNPVSIAGIKGFQKEMSKKGYSLFDNNENGETFLHYLFKKGRTALAKNIINCFGEDVLSVKDKDGKIPFYYFDKETSRSSPYQNDQMFVLASEYLQEKEKAEFSESCKHNNNKSLRI